MKEAVTNYVKVLFLAELKKKHENDLRQNCQWSGQDLNQVPTEYRHLLPLQTYSVTLKKWENFPNNIARNQILVALDIASHVTDSFTMPCLWVLLL